MHGTNDLESCPVVRLDSEGVNNRVLAPNPTEFAWRIADGSLSDEHRPPTPTLRLWLAERLPRTTATMGPEPATDAALEAWIDAEIAAAADPDPT